jgi:hypothetical protein
MELKPQLPKMHIPDRLKPDTNRPLRPPEPRWPVAVALIAVSTLNFALPSSISPGPDWLVLVLVGSLSGPAMLMHRYRRSSAAMVLGFAALIVVTLAMIVSLWLLIAALLSHKEEAGRMLLSAVLLWTSNILVFACWYWRLDAGGPHQRDLQGAHTDGAFLFPQMMLDPVLREQMGEQDWRPGFIDYLFLAFNTSTAFSPTDVPVMDRWAKLLMMVQASISLATLALLAARAVNIL